MAIQRLCHSIPWWLIPSHSCSQKSHFLLELFYTQQIGKRSQLNMKLLLQDMVGFVSRVPLIAKLVRHFIAIPRVMTVIELTAVKDRHEKWVKHLWSDNDKIKALLGVDACPVWCLYGLSILSDTAVSHIHEMRTKIRLKSLSALWWMCCGPC